MIREKVVSYVRENGIKQVYLSRETGLSKNAISAIMNHKRDIEVDEYCAICKALNLPIDYFTTTFTTPPSGRPRTARERG